MKLPQFIQNIRPEKLAYYSLMGAVVLVVGSFAIWRIVSYFSPQQTSFGCDSNNICTTATLRISDYSEPNCPGTARLPLSNSMSDNTVPCFADNALNATTLLTGNQNNFNLFRLQGQLQYR